MPALKKGADGPWEFRRLSGYFQVGGRKNVAFQLDLKVTSPGKGEERTQPEQRQRQDTERCWVGSVSGGAQSLFSGLGEVGWAVRPGP